MSNGILNAYTDIEKTKLSNVSDGAEVNVQSDWDQTTITEDDFIKNKPALGASDKILVRRTTDQSIGTGDTIIGFDTTVYNAGLTMSAGVITIANDGYYTGSLETFIDESGDPDMWMWVECKPFSTGVWQLCGGSAIRFKVRSDTGTGLFFNGSFDFLAGDEIRIVMIKESGSDTADLETRTRVVSLGTVTQFPASLNIYMVG